MKRAHGTRMGLLFTSGALMISLLAAGCGGEGGASTEMTRQTTHADGTAVATAPAETSAGQSSTTRTATRVDGTASTKTAKGTGRPSAVVPPVRSTAKRTTTAARATASEPAATQKPTTTTKAGPRPTIAGPAGSEILDNLTYDNAGRPMGDNDGPAYLVSSKRGYNVCSIDVILSEVDVQIYRRSDNRYIIAYIFLGLDITDANGYWKNNLDAGLRYDSTGKWHLFHSIVDVSAPNQSKWYESRVGLDPTHDYRLTLDSSRNDGWATLTAYDLTEGGKAVDSVEFQARYAKKDGSNTAFYQDYALDFPEDTKYTTDGVASKSNWPEITLYNTDEGVYMKNLQIVNATLNGQPWTAAKSDRRVMWPDCNVKKIDYAVVRVSKAAFDTALRLDLDMNR